MSTGSLLNGDKRVIKKRRVINSCQHCRSKKLKCDKEKPFCSTCQKLKIKCIYLNTCQSDDLLSIEERITSLKEQIESLETQREKLENMDQQMIPLTSSLALFSAFRKDRYLKTLLANSKSDGHKLPSKISQEFEREKVQELTIDSIRASLLANNETLYSLVYPHLFNNIILLRTLIDHFFDTELYSSFSYIIRSKFMDRFEKLLDNIPTKIMDPSEYLFLGNLLILMRISALSFYNCGYPTQPPIEVSPLVFPLALLCLEQIKKPLHSHTLEHAQLALLLETYKLYSPESVCCIDDIITLDVNRLIRTAALSDYNIEPDPTNPDSDVIKRVWHTLVDMDFIKLLGDGTCLSIHEKSYNISLPDGTSSDKESSYIISQTFSERSKIYPYIKEISALLLDVRAGSRLSSLKILIESILKYNSTHNLEYIMSLDSETVEQRALKATKFTNLLDLTLLSFMLSYHVFTKLEVIDDHPDTSVFLKWMLKSGNTILKLAYFLDSNQHHFYNLQKHFGYNFNLLSKILQLQHRLFQFHLSLLVRANYLSLRLKSPIFEEIKRIVSNNIKILLANYRKVSGNHIYAKRLHIMHSFFTMKNFGTSINSHIATVLAHSLDDLNITVNSSTLKYYEVVSQTLVELSGDQEVLDASIYDDTTWTSFLSGSGLDSSAIDQLELFLDKQSFIV